MKLIMENWRKFKLSEQAVQQPATAQQPAITQPAPQQAQNANIKTFGDLKKAINGIISKKRKDAVGGSAVEAATGFIVDQIAQTIPGISNVKSAFDFFKKIYDATDDKKTNTVIDKLNVDDQYSKIVDDTVEMAFVKYLADMIMKKSDTEVIPQDFNINNELQNFLKNSYNSRTLTVTK